MAATLARPVPQSVDGRAIPSHLLGDMAEADFSGDLAAQLDRDGYLLVRGLHDPVEVMAARAEVLERLHEVGEIADPPADAVATGASRRAERHPDLGAFWKSVSEGPALRRVVNGRRALDFAARLFGEPAAHFSFAWLRAMPPGRASPLHVDHPYMNRGTSRLVTSWTPLGAVARDEGPLYVVEGSHRDASLRAGPCVMVNIIGERPDATSLLGVPGLHLHDYGKAARPGRKIGHATLLPPPAGWERHPAVAALLA